MKKILLLALLPTILYGQMPINNQNNTVQMQFMLDVDMTEDFVDRFDQVEAAVQVVEVSITLELFIERVNQETRAHLSHFNNLPQHLVSFSLVHSNPHEVYTSEMNNRLNYSLAQYDPETPGDDTILDWLAPVYQKNRIKTPNNLPRGFGPSFRL